MSSRYVVPAVAETCLYSQWNKEAHEIKMEGNRLNYVLDLDPSRPQLQLVQLVDVTKDE